ncbi:Lrp/AsnC family transcriptional regulator [Streptomyces iconiensis]|uniref:Lrp/AsnC family transcriptional regulator n=1 Tax=Streptomyces iconiensis TaxID=1384038 RepID=A0ABT7A2W1_9ACTN|nr:Lrp/AsnC family transcriptional regulator [Streptomyces iconiensis]MDJ1135636.1 Lrp/AsnC family transcriptional regulator [Streptomyces iconiensis]
MVDAIDREIIHALQLDGRASFRAIGQIIGASPQTVTRRYAHLRTTASLRVLGRTQPYALGDEEWFLRVRCTPDATDRVARALARHEETVWIHVTSGGTEIVCTTRNPEGREPLLLRNLPKTPRVTSMTAHCLLHSYYGGPQSLVDKVRPLDPEQIAALTVPSRPPRPTHLTGTDRAILRVLYEDARASNQELAVAAGCSQSTAQRRVSELRHSGVLYFDVDYDPAVLERSRVAMLWAAVAPAHLEEAGRALAQHDAVSFAASTTGPTNLYAAITCTDNRALHGYLTGPVAALPGLTQVESAPVTRTLKRAGLATGA